MFRNTNNIMDTFRTGFRLIGMDIAFLFAPSVLTEWSRIPDYMQGIRVRQRIIRDQKVEISNRGKYIQNLQNMISERNAEISRLKRKTRKSSRKSK